MISLNVFGRFEKFNINYTQLITQNAEQKLWNMNIRLCRWCWCMTGLTPRSSALTVKVVHPLFTAGHKTMPKKLSFSTCFNSYSTQCLCFKSFLIHFKNVSKLLCDQLLNHSASSACAWHGFSWINASNSSSSNFLHALELSLCSTSMSLFLKRRNISARCFRLSVGAVSLKKNSVSFDNRFLLNKVVQ